jgi:hypothetical protein
MRTGASPAAAERRGGVYARCSKEGSQKGHQIQIQIEECYEEKGSQKEEEVTL